MKSLKKMLALLLAVLMILSVTSVSAFAEGEDVTEEPIPGTEEETQLNPFDLIGGFFERIADFFSIIFRFLENFFMGNGDNALGDM